MTVADDSQSLQSASDEPLMLRTKEDMRVAANPTRMRILAALRMQGVKTVGELARLTGEAPGSVSYHLHRLAKVGAVRQVPAPSDAAPDARTSHWEACQAATEVPQDARPGTSGISGSPMADEVMRTMSASISLAFNRFLDARGAMGTEWRDRCILSDWPLRLTAEEWDAFDNELRALLDRWSKDSETHRPGDGSQLMVLAVNGFRWVP